MKILYCLQSTHNSGGMERIVISKANKLANLGHLVYIVTNSQHDRNSFFKIEDRIKCIDLNINYDEIENESFLKNLKLEQRKLLKFIFQKISGSTEIDTAFGN